MLVEFDKERTVVVSQRLIEAWRAREKGFQGLEYLEFKLLPPEIPRGSRQHALLLFFWAWLNRYGQAGERIMKMGAELAVSHQTIIDSRRECPDRNLELLIPLMPFTRRNSRLADVDQEGIRRVGEWQRVREILHEQYSDDPTQILLRRPPVREELIKCLCEFPGIGAKIAQLFIIWLQEVGWEENPALWRKIRQIRVFPVDLWVLRLIRQLDLVRQWQTDHHDRLRNEVSDFFVVCCEDKDLSHIELSQAIWQLGANICRRRPRRERPAEIFCFQRCPVYDFCRFIIQPAGLYRYKQDGMMGWNEVASRRSLFFPTFY